MMPDGIKWNMALQSILIVIVMPGVALVRLNHLIETRELFDLLIIAGYTLIFWTNAVFLRWMYRTQRKRA